MGDNTINSAIVKNKEYLKSKLGEGFDIHYRHFIIPALANSNAMIVYIAGLVDSNVLDEFVLAPLMTSCQLPKGQTILKNNMSIATLMESGIFVSVVEETDEWNDICDAVLSGATALFVEKSTNALLISAEKKEGRSISEPVSEIEIRGPRDGFVEKLQTNMVLIRSRIKDYGLRFESIKIGERTKTDVVLAYIDGLVNDGILQELRTRLKRIKVDSILAAAYIEEFIEDNPYTVFPQIEHTERPDRVSAAILEGRIAILVDNTPNVLVVPTTFWNFLQTGGDYYERYHMGSFFRWIRLIALFLSVSLSSLYVIVTSYHQEMIPTALALKIAADRYQVPFPAVAEALFMETILEIMKEAGLRIPRPIGQSVSIVGSLVIGQAAVSAGLVGPALVVIVAVSAISSYAIPSYSMSNSFRLLRFPLLLLSSTLGIFGFLGGLMAISLHLMSLRSFGESFLTPVIPFDKGGLKDIFVRAPWWKMLKRPGLSHPKDSNRQASENLKPRPPTK